jgi:hypothetical protein
MGRGKLHDFLSLGSGLLRNAGGFPFSLPFLFHLLGLAHKTLSKVISYKSFASVQVNKKDIRRLIHK